MIKVLQEMMKSEQANGGKTKQQQDSEQSAKDEQHPIDHIETNMDDILKTANQLHTTIKKMKPFFNGFK